MTHMTLPRKIAAGVSALLLAGTIATATVAPVPTAEAGVAPTPCRTWRGYTTGNVTCSYGSYRVGAACYWWTGGMFVRNSAWSVPAPRTATVSCPWGSNVGEYGAFWSDGRLIRFF